MIEIRRLLTERSCIDPCDGPYMRTVQILQYRQTINDDEPCGDRLWSEWIDVPDVTDEENQ